MTSKQQKDSDSSKKGSSNNSGDGRGFAGMDPERQREIAAKGGRHSHGGHGGSDSGEESSDRSSSSSSSSSEDSNQSSGQGSSGSSGRGFAAMDPERQREIASKGGRESHKNDPDR